MIYPDGSLHRVSRHNADGFDRDSRKGFTFFTAVAHGHGGVPNPAEHVIAPDEPAKGGVFAIQESGIRQANEELASGRIGVLRPGHGNNATLMLPVIELGLNRMSGTPGAPVIFATGIFGQGIAALNHEPLYNPVKCCPVIVSLLGKRFEILNGLWGDFRPELKDHFPSAGFQDREVFCRCAHKQSYALVI
jgi:hypothetical protein